MITQKELDFLDRIGRELAGGVGYPTEALLYLIAKKQGALQEAGI